MKRFLVLLFPAVAWLCLSVPVAQADVGGQVPGPGLCDYPGIGSSGMNMSTYFYFCDFPTEENGSHWHCEYGGLAGFGTAGVNVMMLQANLGGNLGALDGSCTWRCPDMSLAAAPNPPGNWRNYLAPRKCQSIGAPPPPPPGAPGPPSPVQSPAVTNPDNPNPEATVNPPTYNR